MTTRLYLGLFSLALAVACTPSDDKSGNDGSNDDTTGDTDDGSGTEATDSDGDGLSDEDEAALGTDPADDDSDDDGLKDSEEAALGADPMAWDSDGDTYGDGWEVTEGHDPADADDRIYTGYWLYNPDKDSIEDPGWSGRARSGNVLPRFAYLDQFGDTVDIYDMSNQGVPVIIDLSGAWCYWCIEMASWLDHEPSALSTYYGSEDWYDVIPEMVDDGELIWVTVIDANAMGGVPTETTIDRWYGDHPNPMVPVLLEDTGALTDYISPAGYPSVMLVNEDMTIEMVPSDYTRVFSTILSDYTD